MLEELPGGAFQFNLSPDVIRDMVEFSEGFGGSIDLR
jgi:hypothetical protein